MHKQKIKDSYWHCMESLFITSLIIHKRFEAQCGEDFGLIQKRQNYGILLNNQQYFVGT